MLAIAAGVSVILGKNEKNIDELIISGSEKNLYHKFCSFKRESFNKISFILLYL